jgi:hypothetical protein
MAWLGYFFRKRPDSLAIQLPITGANFGLFPFCCGRGPKKHLKSKGEYKRKFTTGCRNAVGDNLIEIYRLQVFITSNWTLDKPAVGRNATLHEI